MRQRNRSTMSSPLKWFCLALTLTVLVQLVMVSSLKCYECTGANCNTDAGHPDPEKTCTGDVCITVSLREDNRKPVIEHQTCREFKYFTNFHQSYSQANVSIGSCSHKTFGDWINEVGQMAEQGSKFDVDASDFFIVCSCDINDLCNDGVGEESETYGKRTALKKDGSSQGSSHSLSNFVLGGAIVIMIMIAQTA